VASEFDAGVYVKAGAGGAVGTVIVDKSKSSISGTLLSVSAGCVYVGAVTKAMSVADPISDTGGIVIVDISSADASEFVATVYVIVGIPGATGAVIVDRSISSITGITSSIKIGFTYNGDSGIVMLAISVVDVMPIDDADPSPPVASSYAMLGSGGGTGADIPDRSKSSIDGIESIETDGFVYVKAGAEGSAGGAIKERSKSDIDGIPESDMPGFV
jgi:hypothetical protein